MIAPVETYGEAFYSIRRHENVNTCRFLPVAAPFADPGFDPVANNPPRSISDTPPHSRGAFRVRAVAIIALEIERAQGRPGAGRTHGPPANKKQAASPQVQPKHPAFPARWF
jgi:hypothetical protein